MTLQFSNQMVFFRRFSRAFSVKNGPIRVVLCEFWVYSILLPWSSIFYRMIGGRYWGLWVSTFTFWRGYQNRTWKVLPKWRQASVEQTCKHFYIVRNFEESKVRKFYLGWGYWLLNLSSVTIILEITLYPKCYIIALND